MLLTLLCEYERSLDQSEIHVFFVQACALRHDPALVLERIGQRAIVLVPKQVTNELLRLDLPLVAHGRHRVHDRECVYAGHRLHAPGDRELFEGMLSRWILVFGDVAIRHMLEVALNYVAQIFSG
jgi:hypothetical protein